MNSGLTPYLINKLCNSDNIFSTVYNRHAQHRPDIRRVIVSDIMDNHFVLSSPLIDVRYVESFV